MEAASKCKKEKSEKNEKELSARLADWNKAKAVEQERKPELEKKKAVLENKRDELQPKVNKLRLDPEK